MTTRAWTLILLIGDYVLFMAALLVALLFLGQYEVSETYLVRHLQLFGQLFAVWLMAFYVEGLYSLRTPSVKSMPVSLLRALALSVILSVLFFYLFPNPGITPKRNLLGIAGVALPLCFLWHKLVRGLAASKKHRVALITDAKSAQLIKTDLELRPWLGYQVSQELSDLRLLDKTKVDLVVVGRTEMKDPLTAQTMLNLLSEEINVVDAAMFTEAISGKVAISTLDESWFLEACGTHSTPIAKLAKNAMDKGIALSLAVIVIPLYCILLPILWVISGRPLFFSQIRTGRFERPFRIWKLRTMVVDAEKGGAQWATPGDARITPIGKFLRKTRLDELPQLWNILSGDMSIVGPRPERPELIERKLAPAIPFYRQRHLVKPGVTGWAQVNFRYGYSEDDSLEKLQYDLYYVKNQSFWLDVRILLRTAKTVLTGAGQ